MSNFNPPITSDIAVCLNYHDGMFLTAQNMTLEQNYFSNWIKLQNQCLYTPGVLSGFAAKKSGNVVQVDPGVGFDSVGDFLVFPGTSGNMLPPAGNLGNPYGVFAVYPPTVSSVSDSVDMAAVLQNGSLTYPPLNAILLASVTLDATLTTIDSVTDSRVAVTSRLPAKLTTQAMSNASLQRDLNGARQGSVTFDTRTLLKVGDSLELVVPYLNGGGKAFDVPPNVNATVFGAVAYALNVSAVGNSQFSLRLTAIQTRADIVPSVLVNWLALPNSSSLENA
jgi:hypothetical protein